MYGFGVFCFYFLKATRERLLFDFFHSVGTIEHMNDITIPKRLAGKDDLVVIPRREYEKFSLWKNVVRVRLDEEWFWTPEWQKKEHEADEAIRKGKTKGPFLDHASLVAALKRKKKL